MAPHINSPKGFYVGQIRLRGHRIWQSIGKSRKSPKPAMIAAINAMGQNHKRARVLFCTEWYDPIIVMELNR